MIKSVQSKSEPIPKSYPWLGKWEDIIVLFTAKGIGTCLANNNISYIGKHQTNWSETAYQPLEGGVTLSNE